MRTLLACLSTAALLTRSYGHSPAYDRPVHSIVISLVVCAVVLTIIDRSRLDYFKRPSSIRDGDDHGISLRSIDGYLDGSQSRKATHQSKRWIFSRQLQLILAGIILLAARVEVFRHIFNNVQCTSRSPEVFLPLLIALYDVKRQARVQFKIEDRSVEDMNESFLIILKRKLVAPAWRYIPSALLLSISCYAITGFWQSRTSTFICPIASGHALLIPRLQLMSTFLDFLLIIIAERLSLLEAWTSTSPLSILKSYSAVLLGTACCWTVYAAILFSARPESRSWLLLFDLSFGSVYFYSLIWHVVLLITFFITMTHCIIHHGILLTATYITAVLTLIPALSLVYYAGPPFPPISLPILTWTFPCTLFSLWMFHVIRQGVGTTSMPLWQSWMLIPIFLIIFLMSPGILSPNHIHFHPIDLLMFDAKDQHQKYLSYASHSKDLRTAVDVYKGRYESTPPPGFDLWWQFAQNRSVTITDDFDQIHLDLLPFRTISPSDLRRQTWEMVSNPYNEISGISIRNGSARVQANAAPDHYWMLEGVTVLINSFAQYLPDMDLAFNLNDECRVALPYNDLATTMQKAKDHPLNGFLAGNKSRDLDWKPVAEDEYTETVFENWSFQNTYARFGSASCQSSSAARSRGRRMGQAYLCTECAAPHSVSQFVKDWYLAADPCHQPDLADLHGFYTSPAAFKGSRHLLPVFSQSKAHGYNDILYPSAWNYMDKAKYDPTNSSGVPGTDGYVAGHPDPGFSDKENKLYWRGATTEGVSAGEGAWQGMTRQRLVHMVNNLTNSHHDHTTVLLPEAASGGEGYTYKSLSARSLLLIGLQADVKLVDHVVRCGGIDCTDQEGEFGFAAPVDFQDHWKYRYLFDMDGAGFSGRFLPFLQSHSLPFKTGLFREWYDSRITAWRHFVPQDIRLHGVWSTLAYFAGINGVVDGKPVTWNGHPREAELIAEEGRSWAEQALRKEDMEVYFFRLLLEWGRLTDDRRDELGFSLA